MKLFVQAPAAIHVTADAYMGFGDAPKSVRQRTELAALDGVRFSAALRDLGERLVAG